MIPTDDLMTDEMNLEVVEICSDTNQNSFMPDTDSISLDILSRNASNVTVRNSSNVTVRNRTMRKQTKSAMQLPEIDTTNELNIFQVAASEPHYNHNDKSDGDFDHISYSNLNSYNNNNNIECNSHSDATNGEHSSTNLSNEDDPNDTISDINDFNLQSGKLKNYLLLILG